MSFPDPTPQSKQNQTKMKPETPEYPFPCHDCQGLIQKPDPAKTCAAGYATLPNGGGRICYPCADKREREELKDNSKPFCAYVSSDGKSITTWTGGELMKITLWWTVRLTRLSFTHGRTIRHIQALDCHGKRWWGRGNPGIAIRMRPCKERPVKVPPPPVPLSIVH
jgi:hypothetical protein